jgi:Tfp pilus assembly protein PilF
LFQAAIQKDPSYARAYVGLAMAGMELSNFVPSRDAMERARAALSQALKLDPDSGDAHWLLAEIVQNQDWDWPRAEREFQLALEHGAQAATNASYGSALARYGRFSEAQAQCTAAGNLEPLGVSPRFCQFYVYYYRRQLPQARKMLVETLDLNPDLIYAHVLLGRIALAEKNCAEAARQLDWSASRLPAPAATLAAAYESACRGEVDRARGYLKKAAASVPPAKSEALAIGYALAGDKDAAIAYLQKSAAARENILEALNEPAFDAMRNDPRFKALEKMAGVAR